MAAAPVPSRLPDAPEPATVVTASVAMLMRRILKLPVSATYMKAKVGSKTMKVGLANCAEVAGVVSKEPAVPVPAKVVTMPVASVSLRTRLLPPSP